MTPNRSGPVKHVFPCCFAWPHVWLRTTGTPCSLHSIFKYWMKVIFSCLLVFWHHQGIFHSIWKPEFFDFRGLLRFLGELWDREILPRGGAASPIPLECPGNLWEVPLTESLRKKIREPFAWHLITTYYNQNHNQNSDYLFQNRNRNCPNCQDSFLICFFNYSFWNQCFKKSGTVPAPSFLITRSVLVCLGGAEMGRLW
jgi:hypothetical protein